MKCVAKNKAIAHKLARARFAFKDGFRIGRAWFVAALLCLLVPTLAQARPRWQHQQAPQITVTQRAVSAVHVSGTGAQAHAEYLARTRTIQHATYLPTGMEVIAPANSPAEAMAIWQRSPAHWSLIQAYGLREVACAGGFCVGR